MFHASLIYIPGLLRTSSVYTWHQIVENAATGFDKTEVEEVSYCTLFRLCFYVGCCLLHKLVDSL